MPKKKAEAQDIAVRYTAKALEIVPGVPQRDLTAEEWAAIPEEVRQAALASGHYELVQEGE